MCIMYCMYCFLMIYPFYPILSDLLNRFHWCVWLLHDLCIFVPLDDSIYSITITSITHFFPDDFPVGCKCFTSNQVTKICWICWSCWHNNTWASPQCCHSGSILHPESKLHSPHFTSLFRKKRQNKSQKCTTCTIINIITFITISQLDQHGDTTNFKKEHSESKLLLVQSLSHAVRWSVPLWISLASQFLFGQSCLVSMPCEEPFGNKAFGTRNCIIAGRMWFSPVILAFFDFCVHYVH